MLEKNKIYNGDCLEVMKDIDTGSIDMILADLPYNMTKNKWDKNVIPLDELWLQYNRIIKDNGAIVLFAQGMFMAKLIMSNPKMYRYDIIWKKGDRVSGFLNLKRQFIRNHEQLLIFYKKQPVYHPQFTEGKPLHGKGKKYLEEQGVNNNYGKYDTTIKETRKGSTQKYPKSVLNFDKPHPAQHPTEKPVLLCEYLIETYTNKGELVLDNTCGIGTTCVAAKNIERDYIGIEIDDNWCRISRNRLK